MSTQETIIIIIIVVVISPTKIGVPAVARSSSLLCLINSPRSTHTKHTHTHLHFTFFHCFVIRHQGYIDCPVALALCINLHIILVCILSLTLSPTLFFPYSLSLLCHSDLAVCSVAKPCECVPNDSIRCHFHWPQPPPPTPPQIRRNGVH